VRLSRAEAVGVVARAVGKSPRRYRARAEFLFDGIELDGQRVLDVGCGPGTYALWAGMHGAEYVLGIEPEADGSTSGTLDRFRQTVTKLGLDESVEVAGAFLQDLDVPDKPFDVVVMYNVINHLDEDAVARLHKDASAAERFVDLLAPLTEMMSDGGYLILADCGRDNFWGRFGLRSPAAPSIDWDIHQQPEVWSQVMAKLGFREHDVRWSPQFPLGRLSANRLFQYFTASHFVLRLRAPG